MSEQDPAPAPTEQDELKARNEQLEARVAELEDQRLRALAELDNVRKRAAKEAERERARVLAELLPVLDNLDLALQHADAEPAAIVPGVRAVLEQALTLLDRLGFPRQEDADREFDPARHEAVGTVESGDIPPGTVVHVVRPGYGEGRRQLRPAKVIVSKAD
ncbi:molecular chaperone GrpE [Sinosporangium album]|uniref:Protein GrpE n=1 Tax=Sinosporangium album TaxID=504805 RepID=A0A1G7YSL8_9ACTN|nr:nucleotide exchange factor GrpE [Sinosporangium album]SDG99582.1 molecular chaperone GrpE [Sinosporangium album]